MAVTAAEPTALQAAEIARGEQPHKDSALRLFLTPIVLVVLTAITMTILFSLNLDSIEQRNIVPSNLLNLTWQHIVLTAISAAAVVIIAIPLGILVTRRSLRFLAAPITILANLGQAIPVIGLLVLLAVLFVEANFFAAPLAITVCVIYGVLPVLRNTITGIEAIDPALIEAAKGIGMTPWRILTRVELPLAVPYILAGLRTTLVLIVGVATLGTFVNAGGLGDLIVTGIKLERPVILFAGGILAVVLALLIDWVGGLVERALTPKGL